MCAYGNTIIIDVLEFLFQAYWPLVAKPAHSSCVRAMLFAGKLQSLAHAWQPRMPTTSSRGGGAWVSFVVQNLIRERTSTLRFEFRFHGIWHFVFSSWLCSSSGVSVFAILGGRRIRHPRAPRRPRPGAAACPRTLRAGASSAAAAAAGRCAATCRPGSAHNLGWSEEQSSAALL